MTEYERALTDELSRINEKIEKAIEIAVRYGQIDGGHHKMWVIDQMVRLLVSEEMYEEIKGEEEWDEGIAP